MEQELESRNNKSACVGMVRRVHCAPANFGRARTKSPCVFPLHLRKMRTSFDFCEAAILARSQGVFHTAAPSPVTNRQLLSNHEQIITQKPVESKIIFQSTTVGIQNEDENYPYNVLLI